MEQLCLIGSLQAEEARLKTFNLETLMQEQGFLGKPRIVDANEFQKIVDQGATPIYRGLGGQTQEIVDEYVARHYLQEIHLLSAAVSLVMVLILLQTAELLIDFAKSRRKQEKLNFKFGEVVEGVLDPQAKVIDIEDLWKLRNEYVERMPYHGALAQAYEDDIGLFATTQGYDAIINKNPMIGYTPDGQRKLCTWLLLHNS
jgi:hypothetical protein